MDPVLSKKSNLSEQNKNRSDFGLRIYEKIKMFVVKNKKLNIDYLKKDKSLTELVLKSQAQIKRIESLKSKTEPVIESLKSQLNQLENDNDILLNNIKLEVAK